MYSINFKSLQLITAYCQKTAIKKENLNAYTRSKICLLNKQKNINIYVKRRNGMHKFVNKVLKKKGMNILGKKIREE